MVHNFEESLAFSQNQSDAPFWGEVYRSAFPNLQTMTCVRQDGWAQRGGIDRILVLKSGKTLAIDEKVRKEDWPDILLERWSDEEKKVPGWVQKDLACDFIAYAFIPSQKCYLLPFLTLRRAWIKNGRIWIQNHREIRADNGSYTTVSVAIPIDILMDSIIDSICVGWKN